MNNLRRRELSDLSTKLSFAKTNEAIQSCIDELERILSDEQVYFDSMPENLQGSMRGMDSEEAIDSMDSAIESLNEALDSDGEERQDLIEEAIDMIETAQI